jgi:hypothetical protein
MYQMTGHTRHGDYRANAFYRWCFENDVNIVDILAERAHDVGVKLFVSLMMERSFSPDKAMKEHPEWTIQRGRGRWDYALPEVQDYQIKKITWIMENHDIDGFIVDFTRYGYYFNEDEPDKFGHMNAFLRQLRNATDAVNTGNERNVALCVSFGDRSWHLTRWGTGKLEDQGLDVQTWLDEGLFDLMMPEGPTALEYVERAKDSRTEVWPRFVNRVTIKTHQSVRGGESPKEIEQGVKWAFDQGAPGIFLFNYEPWTTLGRLGFRDELEQRVQTDAVHGLCDGPRVTFAEWYPTLSQRERQREAFKPLTIALGPGSRVNGELTIPVHNTFPVPVTARVQWETPEYDAAQPWTISPTDADMEIPAGSHGELRFHLSGDAPSLSAAPSAHIVLGAGDQVVLRQRVPLRPVPGLVCRKSQGSPSPDRVEFQPFPETDSDARAPAHWSVAGYYDETCLYVFSRCTGIDPSSIEREPPKRDSGGVTQGAHLRILLDPSSTEQSFHRFVATPAGGMADSHHAYDSFLGHFRRKTDWNAAWSTETVWQENGFVTICTIPFEALGVAPVSGSIWRMNLLGVVDSDDSHVARVWSGDGLRSRESPESFGTLTFE